MERIIRQIDMSKVEEDLLLHPPMVAEPAIVATARDVRRRHWAHSLWVVTATLSTILVFSTMAHSVPLSAQPQSGVPAVSDGRVVRLEDKLDRAVADIQVNNTDIRNVVERMNRIEGGQEAIRNLVVLMGSVITIVAGAAAILTRKSKIP